MKELKFWYENYRPYTDNTRYDKAMAEIQASIKEVGIRKTKKILKESFPLIKLYKLYNGKYELSNGCAIAYVDFKQTYITKDEYYSSRVEGYTLSPVLVNSGYYNYVSLDQPIYGGYPLSLWIAHGEECEDCGTVFLANDGDTLCNVCEQLNQAMEYSTRAEDVLGFEDTNETLFGVELEYEKVTAREVTKSLKGHAIAKRDGSIRNGVEVVTRPACIKTHKNSLKAFYDQVKVKAESNTGMHVHIDKRKLSQYQIGFMLQFLNDTELVKNLEEIAGRSYSTNAYCRPRAGTVMTTGISYDEYAKKLVRSSTEKYSPLNTKKDNTIEIRIFSSPESHEEMAAKLDFVNALVKYSSPYSISVKSLKDKFQWETFIGFVQANKKDFPDFVSFYLKG